MMDKEDKEYPIVTCGVCGGPIAEGGLAYQITYGTVMQGAFRPQEHYMTVHSHCLKE